MASDSVFVRWSKARMSGSCIISFLRFVNNFVSLVGNNPRDSQRQVLEMFNDGGCVAYYVSMF